MSTRISWHFFLVFILAIVLSGCANPPYDDLDNEQLKTKLEQNIPIYDIRRADEWRQTGVIENSKLLTFVDGHGRVQPEFLSKFTSEINKNDPVILICRTGNRTDTLARYLIEQMAYTQVYNVRHGINRWIREKRPVDHL